MSSKPKFIRSNLFPLNNEFRCMIHRSRDWTLLFHSTTSYITAPSSSISFDEVLTVVSK